ncbi:hypothetical protein H8356DRAFT_1376686 [Neocallimastix lanati (nom. inval.)]|nr:hypothetical protein H8356DRAFT_1376686 [Neocallimastix sp. JGI-2020a]
MNKKSYKSYDSLKGIPRCILIHSTGECFSKNDAHLKKCSMGHSLNENYLEGILNNYSSPQESWDSNQPISMSEIHSTVLLIKKNNKAPGDLSYCNNYPVIFRSSTIGLKISNSHSLLSVKTQSLSIKRIRPSLDSLSYYFGVDAYLSISKFNMKGIPYITIYMTGFFSMIA